LQRLKLPLAVLLVKAVLLTVNVPALAMPPPELLRPPVRGVPAALQQRSP
jgi:hypothetical protein